MRTRTSGIDILKFLFSIAIFLCHFNVIAYGGYLMVEGFFMITGFLFMAKLYGASSTENDSSARFVLNKYRSIFFSLLYSAIIGFVIYEVLIHTYPTDILFSQRLPLLLFEIVPLQVAGFDGIWATGVSWYLSAMLIVLAIFHPLAKKNPLRFAYSVCPIIVVLGYGVLCANFHQLDVPCSWLLNIFNSGIIRAAAGISAGVILFALTKRDNKKPIGTLKRIFFTAVELCAIAAIVAIITKSELARTSIDYFVAALLFLLLYIVLSQKSLFALFINRKWTKVLSTFSTYFFLNHYAIGSFIKFKYAAQYESAPLTLLPKYILYSLASTAVVFILTTVTEKIIKLIKKSKKRTV